MSNRPSLTRKKLSNKDHNHANLYKLQVEKKTLTRVEVILWFDFDNGKHGLTLISKDKLDHFRDYIFGTICSTVF